MPSLVLIVLFYILTIIMYSYLQMNLSLNVKFIHYTLHISWTKIFQSIALINRVGIV